MSFVLGKLSEMFCVSAKFNSLNYPLIAADPFTAVTLASFTNVFKKSLFSSERLWCYFLSAI